MTRVAFTITHCAPILILAAALVGQHPRLTIPGDRAGDQFGASIAPFGDQDRDGSPDLLIGAPGTDAKGTDSGHARIVSGKTRKVMLRFDGESAGDRFGECVAAIRDVNGDGYIDAAIGAPFDDNVGKDSGSVRVVSGKDGTVLYTINGTAAGDRFGTSISSGFDVNKDGIADFCVGAPWHAASKGLVQIISGGDGKVINTFTGGQAGDRLGSAAEMIRDLLRDGSPDVAIGAPGSASARGQFRIHDASSGKLIFQRSGNSVGDRLGESISLVNYNLLAIGAPGANGNGKDAGRVSYFNSRYPLHAIMYPGNPGPAFSLTVDGEPGEQLGASLPRGAVDVDHDSTADFLMASARNGGAGRVLVRSGRTNLDIRSYYGSGQRGTGFGMAIALAGDLDDDGVDDIAIAEPGFTSGSNAGTGAVHIISTERPSVVRLYISKRVGDYYGTSIDTLRDLDNDKVPDLIVGADWSSDPRADIISGKTGKLIRSHKGNSSRGQFGGTVCMIGDLDKDGYDDYAIGDIELGQSGYVEVFSGKSGTLLRRWKGPARYDNYGESIAPVGDIDKDGYPDVLVGASQVSHTPSMPGFVHLISGKTSKILRTIRGKTAGDLFGRACANAGDVNKDGTTDFVIGAEQDTRVGYAQVISGKTGLVLYTFTGNTNHSGRWTDHGHAVLGAGDINQDGHADIAVSAAAEADVGTVRIYSGKDGTVLRLLRGTPSKASLPGPYFGSALLRLADLDGDSVPELAIGQSWTTANVGSYLDGRVTVFSGKSGKPLGDFLGEGRLDRFGDALATADIDGDGKPELIVGAPGRNTTRNPPRNSRVYAISLEPTATSTTFGRGCGSSAVPPTLHVLRPPSLGETVLVEARDFVPNQAGLMVLGASNRTWNGAKLPLDLGLMNMTGCSLLVSFDMSIGLASYADGRASFAAQIPRTTTIVGVTAFAQCWMLDPRANATGISTSDGVRLTIGL